MSFSNLLQSLEVTNNKDLFIVTLEDLEIPFVLPPMKLAEQVSSLLNLVEEPYLKYLTLKFLFEKCVVNKFLAKDDDSLPCGVPQTIGQLILYLSGTGESSLDYTKDLLKVSREAANNVFITMKRLICSTFTAYTFEKLDELSYQDIVSLFAYAETTLLENQIIKEPIDFFTEKKKEGPSISERIAQDNKEFQRFENQDPNKNSYNLKNLRGG